MRMCWMAIACRNVAPLTGSVDRNLSTSVRSSSSPQVAPLTGSVDRNLLPKSVWTIGSAVAPLTGSVDRNWYNRIRKGRYTTSLPSRGAWIEMWKLDGIAVASMSLPSRGAWIEIGHPLDEQVNDAVAPLTGSVDRNKREPGKKKNRRSVAPLTGSVDRNASGLPGP